mmetsp:Transcript_53534/g.85551  ORF Transcript_53534/g.85551 Transcript_53534/m.85551 type:complete len:230 (-) Transcript_53534:340-1029(-)
MPPTCHSIYRHRFRNRPHTLDYLGSPTMYRHHRKGPSHNTLALNHCNFLATVLCPRSTSRRWNIDHDTGFVTHPADTDQSRQSNPQSRSLYNWRSSLRGRYTWHSCTNPFVRYQCPGIECTTNHPLHASHSHNEDNYRIEMKMRRHNNQTFDCHLQCNLWYNGHSHPETHTPKLHSTTPKCCCNQWHTLKFLSRCNNIVDMFQLRLSSTTKCSMDINFHQSPYIQLVDM